MSLLCASGNNDLLQVPTQPEVTPKDDGSNNNRIVLANSVEAIIKSLAQNPVWVPSAVSQLKEIDSYLQNKDLDQHQKISDNINNVVSCLQSLDKNRLQLQEELEKEAITTFSLYHTIKNLPSAIEVEIKEAVNAAQVQNVSDIEAKTIIVGELERKICNLREEQLKLEKENNFLLPQRNVIRKQHDVLVFDLNQLLEDKSKKQISVNETKENIRLQNQKIVETEQTIQEIKADFIKVKESANQKIKSFKSEIEKVKRKKELWDQKNVHVCQQLNAVNADLTERKLSLQELQNKEKVQEKNILELKKENHTLKMKIDCEKTAQVELLNNKKKLNEKLAKLKKKFASSYNEKKKIMNDLKIKVENESKQNEKLLQRDEELQQTIIECKETEKDFKKEVEETENKLQSRQAELLEFTEVLAKLDSENSEHKDTCQKTRENHEFTVAKLNREIQRRNRALKEEKHLRRDTEKERDLLMRQLCLIEEQQIKSASKMNEKISKLKDQISEKNTETKELQKILQEKNEEMENLEEETTNLEKRLKKEAEEKQETINELKSAIAVLEETIKEHTKIVEEKTPLFEEFEKKYQNECKIYQECKDTYTIHRRKNIELKKEIEQIEKNLEEMKATQVEQEQKIKVSHEEYFSMLNSNSNEAKLLEETIYIESCKLKSILGENQTIKKGKEKLESELLETKDCIKKGKELQEEILRELIETRNQLTDCFDKAAEIEERLNNEDQQKMQQLSSLFSVLNFNSKQVNDVSVEIFRKLEKLGIYLDKVSSKRPESRAVLRAPPILRPKWEPAQR